MDAPPMAMKAGAGDDVDPPDIEAEKVAVLLPTPTVMDSEPPLMVALREDGGAGSSPSSYCSMALRISSWRQLHWSAVVTRVPSAKTKGSGSMLVDAAGMSVAGEQAWRCRSGEDKAGVVGRPRATLPRKKEAMRADVMVESSI